MSEPSRRARERALRLATVLTTTLAVLTMGLAAPLPPAHAAYRSISGAGSTWSANAIQAWAANVRQFGMTVNYNDAGSSIGRQQYASGTVDFAVSEIPFGLKDGDSTETMPTRKFAYMPIVAGGTSFMYNLSIGGRRVTQLRLSGATVSRIFTGAITMWNDPAIRSDNPGLTMPAKRIVPVVRSDGSGTSAQFTAWMLSEHPSIYSAFCARVRRTSCTQTSNYPVPPGSSFVAKAGSNGVSGYVRQPQAEGSITYVEYSYAKRAGFPVAKVLNRAGYYTEPTAQNVAVALLGADIETENTNPAVYLTQKLKGVYRNPDPRTYPLSSYSYVILPTRAEGNFTQDKGRTLGDFSYYFLCQGQQQAEVLGYSPLPINLVKAGLQQVKRIPGVDVQNKDVSKCNNPTFSPDGSNTLAKNAPMPPACDKKSAYQCGTSAQNQPASGGTNQPGAARGGRTPTAAQNGTGTTAGGGTNGTAGTAGTTGGTTASGAGAAAAVDANGDGVADPVALDEFGEPVAGGAIQGAAVAAATPLAVAPRRGWRAQHTFMLLAALALVLLTVGPPVMARRMGGHQ